MYPMDPLRDRAVVDAEEDGAPTQQALARFGAVIAALNEELDWPGLGLVYCEEGGADFFAEEEREAVFDAGLEFAAELGSSLVPGGASLYVGAGVAELAPICFEALVLGRSLTIASLPCFEVDELNRAFAAIEERLACSLPRFVAAPLAELPDSAHQGPFDHAWIVSVLSDPDAFPALHDELYERRTPEEGATGRGDLADDEQRAALLVGDVLQRLGDTALLSTTDEEGRLFGPALLAAGYAVEMPRKGRYSPIVGDVVRHLILTLASQAAPASPWGSGALSADPGASV